MGLKKTIKQHMVRKLTAEYEKKLAWWKRPYSEWISGKEQTEQISEETQEIPVFSFSALQQLSSKEILKIKKSHFVVFYNEKGILRSNALAIIKMTFAEQKDAVVLYGDEDVWKKGEERKGVWYKPEWSPVTYLNFFYFGSVIAFRSEEFLWSYKPGICIHELSTKILQKCGAFGKRTEQIKVVHVPEILFHASTEGLYGDYREWRVVSTENISSKKFVSIVIPSKDNREVLERCIDSLIETIPVTDCEIIVVDNGSEETEKEAIAEMLSLKLVRTTYIYEPMEFNFSKMCNLGISKAKGDYVILLNDDLTCINNRWFEKMCAYVQMPYTGAVGIKLYYPDSTTIQHAGITNVLPGPVHKLQYLKDEGDYYFGCNLLDHNVIAVTGACLMIRKEVLEETGGLCEELDVAFNDVDLCYSLWEKGYYNVVVQDAFLYHHESMSRGRDEDEIKLRRLIKERDLLYKRHPQLEGTDPFYPKGLNRRWLDVRIRPAYGAEEQEQLIEEGKQIEIGFPKKITEDDCLAFAVELAKDDGENIVCAGYCTVLGSNNACFDKELLLWNEEKCYRISISDLYRADIEENLPDQECVGLSGYFVKISKMLIAQGEYRIGMLATDKTSRLKLVNWSKRYITITRNE